MAIPRRRRTAAATIVPSRPRLEPFPPALDGRGQPESIWVTPRRRQYHEQFGVKVERLIIDRLGTDRLRTRHMVEQFRCVVYRMKTMMAALMIMMVRVLCGAFGRMIGRRWWSFGGAASGPGRGLGTCHGSGRNNDG